MDNLIIFVPNIEAILWHLEKSPEKYPPNIRDYDWVFNDFPAIPTCYKFVVNYGDIPDVKDTANYLVLSKYPKFSQLSGNKKKAIRNRALKLTMDFYRDLHAMALLGSSFGTVVYIKGHDLSYNVDFQVTPKPYMLSMYPKIRKTKLGVAAAMQHPRNWRNPEGDIANKKQRRNNRKCKQWPGQIFWLTNQTRPYWRQVNGLWLFGKDHINDLIDDIKAKYQDDQDYEPNIGIVQQLPLF